MSGENPSTDTGDIAEKYSLGCTDGQTHRRKRREAKHMQQRLKNELIYIFP